MTQQRLSCGQCSTMVLHHRRSSSTGSSEVHLEWDTKGLSNRLDLLLEPSAWGYRRALGRAPVQVRARKHQRVWRCVFALFLPQKESFQSTSADRNLSHTRIVLRAIGPLASVRDLVDHKIALAYFLTLVEVFPWQAEHFARSHS